MVQTMERPTVKRIKGIQVGATVNYKGKPHKFIGAFNNTILIEDDKTTVKKLSLRDFELNAKDSKKLSILRGYELSAVLDGELEWVLYDSKNVVDRVTIRGLNYAIGGREYRIIYTVIYKGKLRNDALEGDIVDFVSAMELAVKSLKGGE